MSWSVMAKGNPVDVKKTLEEQFKNAKACTESVPTEHQIVVLQEQATNIALDQMIESGYQEIEVSGYGSGCNNNPGQWKGNTQFTMVVKPITPGAF